VLKRPTVLLADDDRALLDKLRQLLISEFDVVGMVEDGQALLTAANELRPDLFVTDISMPRMNGFQAAKRLKTAQPEARILFLTVHDESVMVSEALAMGVTGYVLKRSAASELIPALHQILRGDQYISSGVRQ
jgi:DNA-binding NarL/FixJ family response regulator